MHTLQGTRHQLGKFPENCSSYFLIYNVPTLLDPLVIILLTFIMYFEIYYQKPNGFNMACYTQIITFMKENFFVKCFFLWNFICKRQKIFQTRKACQENSQWLRVAMYRHRNDGVPHPPPAAQPWRGKRKTQNKSIIKLDLTHYSKSSKKNLFIIRYSTFFSFIQ